MGEGCFVKNVENGGGVFCKKVDLSSTQGALCTVSVFFTLHFSYRKVRTPLAYGHDISHSAAAVVRNISRVAKHGRTSPRQFARAIQNCLRARSLWEIYNDR